MKIDRTRKYKRIKLKNHKKHKYTGIVCIAAMIIIFAFAFVYYNNIEVENIDPQNASASNSAGSSEKTEVVNSETTDSVDIADAQMLISTEETEITTESPEALRERIIEQDARNILDTMSQEEKIYQLFFITPEALTGVGKVIQAGSQTKTALDNYPVGGIIYFAPNFNNEKQAKEMLKNMNDYSKEICKAPLFLGIDEEGGKVARLGNNSNLNVPKVQSMSTIGSTEEALKAGETIGEYLFEYGFNVDFAPVADVITNPENTVVKERSFGSDPNAVTDMAMYFSQGLKSKGISSCFKHFPGHGATKEDSHVGFAYIDKSKDELMQSELVPFKKAAEEGADFIMVGHISIPNITGDNTPASISSKIVNDILREEFGYEGIIITDSLSMGALTNNYNTVDISLKAIEAGVDMLLMPDNFHSAYNGVLKAVNNGTISQERIDESVLRILKVKIKNGLINTSDET